MSEVKKAKRSQFMTFLNTTPGEEPATWSRMGKGITGQTVNYNPQTTTETYIDEDSATTNVDSYQPRIPTPQTVYAGEPCFDFINNLRKKRAIGDDCVTQILMVNAFEAAGEDGSYSAELNACTIQIDDLGGDGGTSLTVNYTINLNGNPTSGSFDPTTKTFTPDGAAG